MERKIIIRKSQHYFDRYRKFLRTLGLAVLVLSIPLTVYVLNQVQDIRQRAAGELIPITSNFPQSGCPVSFTDINTSTNQSYKIPVFCLNQTYCVTQGFGGNTPPGLTFPAFGGDLPITRKYAVAFIAHYRNKAVPQTDGRHWAYNGTAARGGVFKDVPAGSLLGLEIETAQIKGFISGQPCNTVYQSGEPYYSPDSNVKCFDPEGDWIYGFNDTYLDATSGPGQKVAGSVLTRGAFIQQLYSYGINPAHQDLKLCMVAPTSPPVVPPTATPAIACSSACTTDAQCSQATGGCTVCKPTTAPAPIIDFTKLTGSICPRNFAAILPNGVAREPGYTDKNYRLAVECLNKAYCVVQGYSSQTCPAGSSCTDLNLSTTPPEGYLGGELPTSRKFAAAFIARYHVDAIAPTDSRHWNWVTPTGRVFKDVPSGSDLIKEIETAFDKGFISGQPCSSVYKSGEPYYSPDPSVLCFNPEGDWLYGFKGIEKSDYFNGATPINPWNTTIKRGDFLLQLYTFGTSPNTPDLAKCMSAPSSGGSCQPPPACNTGCVKDGDCSGAKDGCTICRGETATTPGKCAPAPACNVGCTKDGDCIGAKDGCTVCSGATTTTPGKCAPAPACNVGCTKDGDCTGAKDGCTVCAGETATTPGKCAPAPACNSTCSNNADCAGGQTGCTFCNSGGKCSPAPACGTSCGSNTDCTLAGGGCNTCNSATNKCSIAACGVACARDGDCAGAATKDGCTSCLGGKCTLPFNPAACKCDGMDATAIGSGQAVTFSAFSKIEGTDVSSAIVKGVNIRVFRGGAEIANQIAESGFINPSIIENTATKIRYKTDWRYIVPSDAQNGDIFRVQADIQCEPKNLAAAPSRTLAKNEKGIIARIVDKVTEPIRAVLGLTAPTPIPAKSLQISSFYPGEVIEKSCNYFRFVIKR